MKKKLYITNLPAFYKINLLNELHKKVDLTVIFLFKSAKNRNNDFYNAEKKFKHVFLGDFNLPDRFNLLRLLCLRFYDEVVIGGWDLRVFWFFWILGNKKMNSLILESSVYESKTKGYQGFLKRIFLSRIGIVYCSGNLQKELLTTLGYKGEVRLTGGVGLQNVPKSLAVRMSKVFTRNFCYIGRLSPEKNLELLLEAFSHRPDLSLTIVGFGPLEGELKAKASGNVYFTGAILNLKLATFLKDMDTLILPSLSEPWGLVIEEALANGLPVIVSDRVGCKQDLVLPNNGLVFSVDSLEDLLDKIDMMSSYEIYSKFQSEVMSLNFEKRALDQIQANI
jgi:glycosyltransferase involved in cell wall biosynthesis